MQRQPLTRRPADKGLSAAEWEAIEDDLKLRSGATCEGRVPGWCLADPRTGALERVPRWRVSIHHRRAKGAGGTDVPWINDRSNLLLLCGDGVSGCHGWCTVGEVGEARRRGIVLPLSCSDPAAVPLELASGRLVMLDAPFYRQVGWRIQRLGESA